MALQITIEAFSGRRSAIAATSWNGPTALATSASRGRAGAGTSGDGEFERLVLESQP
jgi:hypothetical protein